MKTLRWLLGLTSKIKKGRVTFKEFRSSFRFVGPFELPSLLIRENGEELGLQAISYLKNCTLGKYVNTTGTSQPLFFVF